jgi:hypothetical protein
MKQLSAAQPLQSKANQLRKVISMMDVQCTERIIDYERKFIILNRNGTWLTFVIINIYLYYNSKRKSERVLVI